MLNGLSTILYKYTFSLMMSILCGAWCIQAISTGPVTFRVLDILLLFEFQSGSPTMPGTWNLFSIFSLEQCLNNKKFFFFKLNNHKKKTTLLSKGKAFQFYRWILCSLYCFRKTHFNLWLIFPHDTC